MMKSIILMIFNQVHQKNLYQKFFDWNKWEIIFLSLILFMLNLGALIENEGNSDDFSLMKEYIRRFRIVDMVIMDLLSMYWVNWSCIRKASTQLRAGIRWTSQIRKLQISSPLFLTIEMSFWFRHGTCLYISR